MWTYHQRSGEMYAADGTLLAIGYSGHEDGKNDPDKQAEHSIGPIPRGQWSMASLSPPEDVAHGGHYIRLEPKQGTETFGRAGFLIHGDSRSLPGTASLGCIIVPLNKRLQMWNSGDHDLTVEA